MGRSGRKRNILVAKDAAEIYLLREKKLFKACEAFDANMISPLGHSSLVSILYGISPKAVRDIWNRLY